jgi:hypothetical protein
MDLFAGLVSKKLNCICLTSLFRGMGSEGDINKLTRGDFLKDAAAVYDYLVSLGGVDKSDITLVGESFGSYMAAILASIRPVMTLILRVPTDFPEKGFSETPQIQFAGMNSIDWKRQQHAPEESPALQAARDFKGGIHIIASENDTIVPLVTTQNYLSASAGNKNMGYTLMKNTGHGA